MNSNNDINNAIIIKLQGGLGNQLFQYALGRSLSLSAGVSVKYDVSWFETQTKRKYELEKFNARVNIASREEVRRMRKHQAKTGKLSFLNWFFPVDQSVYITEKQFNFDQNILETKPPAYLDGFWQSEKYFVRAAETIRQDLTLKDLPDEKNQALLNQIKSTTTISLHVRRGDYVGNAKTNAFHGAMSLDYYRRAVDYIKNRVPNGTIFVFSDDHAWVKEHLQFDMPTIFVDCNDADHAQDDLRLMLSCQHHIITNSTFSWWGAWLNANPEKIVIAPKKWFMDQTINTADLLPHDWIRV